MRYDHSRILKRFDAGERLKFLFFWGHKQADPPTKTCFSQWYPAEFRHEGLLYRTAEHWMMAEKARIFGDNEMLSAILEAASPGEAKKLGRQVRGFDPEVWNALKYPVVLAGNLLKFTWNPAMRTFLENTGDRIIVEASPRDRIWGIGLGPNNPKAEDPHNWRGRNLLGFALMETRDILRAMGDAQAPEVTMAPPWLRFPDALPGDDGAVADYLAEWRGWQEALEEAERLAYRVKFPGMGKWAGVYSEARSS